MALVDKHSLNKKRLAALRAAMYDFSENGVREQLRAICNGDAVFRVGFPFDAMHGADAFYHQALAPLFSAWPDLERRDSIVIAGTDTDGQDWVGCCGYYVGTSCAPWLDIQATGKLTQMRFHEFFRFIEGEIVETHMLWDIPEVMQQASAWPLAPALGKDGPVPAPAHCAGLNTGEIDEEQSRASRSLIIDMINNMVRHPAEGGPELMHLEKFWHPKMNWYGPAGIGSMRGITGFRRGHQIPFLNAMPDRGQSNEGTAHHFFAENEFAAVTGWPNMSQTLSHAGWLGLPPTGQRITMRSLDFWRVESGLIRENWVMVDLLDVYNQLGIDVFARVRELKQDLSQPGLLLDNEALA
ncbi:MAG: ester cyclase [Granulosicoccus sp.]